jgi:SAM-dependent methyltransferase
VSTSAPPYADIVRHYEKCLQDHGTGARAVNWNSQADANTRYHVMHDLFAHETGPISVLDFGCGLGDFKRYLDNRRSLAVTYEGLDVSPAFAVAAREAHPGTTIHCMDLLDEAACLPDFDYAIMNGVFTRRAPLSHDDMLAYLERLAGKLYTHCRKGIAFNVMSVAADWTSEELFHPTPSELVGVITRALSRHFQLRNDYGLYECTVYAYRHPRC